MSLGTTGSVLTHGPDAPSWFVASAPEVTERPVPCVGESQPHHALVYAHPVDKLSRSTTLAARLRQVARQANYVLHAQAAALLSSVEIPFTCTTAGAPTITSVALPLLSGRATFAHIVANLKALGFTDPQAKYWVFYDDSVAGYSGQATVFRDDRASADNLNNRGPSYAVSYGVADWGIALHEAAHTLGAVQDSAPHATGTLHCNDGLDVMCYADGGPSSSLDISACAVLTFDCNRDDYFDPRPDVGSYLASHWNLASPLNAFLQTQGTGIPLPSSTTSGPAATSSPPPLPPTSLPPTQLGSSDSGSPRGVTIQQQDARGRRLACGTLRRPCRLRRSTTWYVAGLANHARAGETVRVVVRHKRGGRWSIVVRLGGTFRVRRSGSVSYLWRVPRMRTGSWSAQAVLGGRPIRLSTRTYVRVM